MGHRNERKPLAILTSKVFTCVFLIASFQSAVLSQFPVLPSTPQSVTIPRYGNNFGNPTPQPGCPASNI